MVVVNQCRALSLALCLSAAASAQNATLPIIDLGYELHQAAQFDVCIPSQLRRVSAYHEFCVEYYQSV